MTCSTIAFRCFNITRKLSREGGGTVSGGVLSQGRKGWWKWLVCVISVCGFSASATADIASTKHNLSTSGPGPVKAVSETRICVFCHTPHGANPSIPLWNRDVSYQSGIVYVPYSSATLNASPGQPTGATKLCLSCHDGTVAVGQLLRNPAVSMTDSGTGRLTPEGKLSPSAPGYIGTDLSGSHPVSFQVTEALIAANNSSGDTPLNPLSAMTSDPDGVRLDANNELQCTACHDPHDDSNRATSGAPFWRKPGWSDVCRVCHGI